MYGLTLGDIPFVMSATPIQRAIAVLRKFGQNAHAYLPGIGMLNGLQAANYIDSVGTQVGVVDQPVGLDLDAMGGLGVELLTNGDFSNGVVGWASYQASSSVISGELIHVDALGHTYQAVPTVVGKTYKVSATIRKITGDAWVGSQDNGSTYTKRGETTHITSITPTRVEFILLAGFTETMIQCRCSSGLTAGFDNISVREISGIHASQTTTGSKPILRQDANGKYYWQFDGSNDSLQLGGPLFQMSDDHCVIAGGLTSKTSAQATMFINAGGGPVRMPALGVTTATDTLFAEWFDGAQYVPLVTTHPKNTPFVLSARRSGATLLARKNGVQFGFGTAFTTGVAVSEAKLGDGVYGPWQGAIYPIIAIKATVSDADLLLLEKLVASMSGVTLL